MARTYGQKVVDAMIHDQAFASRESLDRWLRESARFNHYTKAILLELLTRNLLKTEK